MVSFIVILFYNSKYLFIFRKIRFELINTIIGKLHGFDPENNYYDEDLVYDQINDSLFKGDFRVNKKRFKNIVLFINYRDFVYNYRNSDNYAIEYYNRKQGDEYSSSHKYIYTDGINPDDFTPDTELVLLSNHGYSKILDVLFIFDPSFSSEIVISRNDPDKAYYSFSMLKSTFVFYGLLLLKNMEKIESVSIKYTYEFHDINVEEHDYMFLLERNDHINDIIKKINPKDKAYSIIKKYFSVYKKNVNKLIGNSDIYKIKDEYELDNLPYSDKLASEKHLLWNYNDSFDYDQLSDLADDSKDDNYRTANPYSYLRYYMIILSSRMITNIITPKELRHDIKLVELPYRTKSKLNTINFFEDDMFFLDRNDSIVLISGNKGLKNIKTVKKLNTKEFLATVLKKQTENLPLFFPNIEYEVKSFYKDSYNWKYLFYFKSLGRYDIELNTTHHNQFHIIMLKEINVKMFGHSFSTLFIRYVIRLDSEYQNPAVLNDIIVHKDDNQFIIFSNTYLQALPHYYVNFFIDEEDIKQINDFIGQNMREYYKDYNRKYYKNTKLPKHDPKLPIYVYGGHFKLKVTLIDRFIEINTKNSFEFYKDGLLYVAILIRDYSDLKVTRDIVTNNKQRRIEFTEFIDKRDKHPSKNAPKIILSMRNNDYVFRGIYRFNFYGVDGFFDLFISFAIPKHKFSSIINEIQNTKNIVIDGVFLMNSIGNVLYLNGFLEEMDSSEELD